MARKDVNWNKVRDVLNETLEAYRSILDIEELDEYRALGNDIITIIRDVYYKGVA